LEYAPSASHVSTSSTTWLPSRGCKFSAHAGRSQKHPRRRRRDCRGVARGLFCLQHFGDGVVLDRLVAAIDKLRPRSVLVVSRSNDRQHRARHLGGDGGDLDFADQEQTLKRFAESAEFVESFFAVVPAPRGRMSLGKSFVALPATHKGSGLRQSKKRVRVGVRVRV